MKAQVKTKELVAAIQKVQAITQNSIVTLTAKGKTIRVAAQGKTNMLSMKVPAEVSAPGAISIESYMLAQTIKSRAEVELHDADSQLHVKGKSLTAKLVTVPVEDVPSFEKSSGSAIAPEIQQALAAAVARVNITNVHDQNPIGFHVSLTKAGLTVVAADSHHMACAVNATVKSKAGVRFKMASDAFATIDSLANKEVYELAFTDSEVLAWNSRFELRIPTLSDDGNGPSEEAISSLLKSLAAEKAGIKATLNTSEFWAALDTMQGIFEGGANVSLTSKDNGIELKFVTSYGESKTLLKAANTKGRFKHQIDLPLTRDAFAFIKGKTLTVAVFNDNRLFAVEEGEDMTCTYIQTLVTQ